MAEGKARCTACQVEFKAKKDGAPYAHKCVPAGPPPSRTCACGEVTTMGPFPGRHEADACGGVESLRAHPEGHLTGSVADPFSSPTKAEKDDGLGPWFLADFDGECDTCDGLIKAGDWIRVDGSCGHECSGCGDEEPHPDESPTHTHHYVWADDGKGHSGSFCACGEEEPEPVTDHRKWCTRCKLLGHYSAGCTTAVLSGGQVSVPVVPRLGDPALIDNACSAADGYAPHVFEWNKWVSASQCVACGEDNPDQPEPDPFTVPSVAALMEAGARVREGLPYTEQPDPFESPTRPTEDLNVSGQPSARYEWYGKQNRGYLVKLPDTGDFRRYKNGKPKGLTRATTFNKAATDQNALGDWKARNVLIGASKRPDLVARAHGLTHEDNRDELMKLVAELETTAGAKVSADVGTLIHELTERWDAGVITMAGIPAAYQPLIVLYTAELQAAGLRPVPGLIERTTYIPEFGGVVGTLDRVYYHEASGQYVIGDVKTGKTLKYGMDEIETQEWIYAHGVNLNGVYDWNTDTWDAMWEGAAIPPEWQPMTSVSEDWGVVVHMPVQGDDAGKVMLVRADLQRGKRHAEVCHQVREERANKPKPEAWTGEELAAPQMPAETDWAVCFSLVQSKDDAAVWWQKAYDAGVPPEEMARLKEIADARLAELHKPDWDRHFSQVGSVSGAGWLWEEARKAGVEPMELGRLVGLAQQRLRELGISG